VSIQPRRRLLLAPFSCPDLTHRLFAAALAEVPGPDFRGIVYLAPNQRKRRAAEYDFARQCGKAGFIPPVFTTPRQLALGLDDLAGAGRRLRSSLRPLLVHRLLKDSAKRATLGLARAQSDFIAAVKTWVAPVDRPGLEAIFKETLDGFEKTLASALEALDVLKRYDAELAAHGRVDDEDARAAAPGRLADAGIAPSMLILDGFADPNPLESRLIAALVAASDVTLASCWSGDPKDPDYALSGRLRALLESLGGFEPEQLDALPRVEPTGIVVFPNREAQLEGIARHLRAQADLSDTTVALPDLGTCAPLVRRVFEQYGVPATLYPELALAASPPVAAVLELLHALETDFERLPFSAALGSPWLPGLLRLPDDSEDAAAWRAAAAVNSISRRAGIIKGRANWEHIAERLAAIEGDRDEAGAEFARDLQRRVRFALGLLDSLPAVEVTPGQQAARLKQLLERVEFGRGVAPGVPETNDLLGDRGSLYDVLDELVAFEADFGAERGSRADFLRTLEYLIGLESSAAEPAQAGVLVSDLAELEGLHPRHVVLGGLTETNLPGPYAADPIMPDRLRRRLGMPDMDRHRDRQRFRLRCALESGREPAFLCGFDSDGGNPVLPTPFLQLPALKPPEPDAYCAPIEEQVESGALTRRLFAERGRTVHFEADRSVRTTLGRRFGPDRAISVTGIEAFRRCPYQFYLERVLGLESPPEPLYEIDAMQWGNTIHRTLERLYEKGPVALDRLADHARTALGTALREASLPAFWAEVTRRVFDNLLPGIVGIEAGLRENGWRPTKTEHIVSGEAAKGITVRGRLDRLDEGPAGLRVLDYKTGAAKVSATNVVEDRTHVQLPLYAHLIAGAGKKPVDNVGIYTLREVRIRLLADDEHPLSGLIEAALATTRQVVEDIRSGRFAALPADEKSCESCDYAYLCSPQEAGEEG
jgi:RecB family exonuclease